MTSRLLIAATALTLSIPAVPASAQVVGVAATIRNRVEVRSAGASKPRTMVVRATIAANDTVETRQQSQLQALLLDKSMFTVGPNARVTIDRYVYDPARNSRSMGATIARGAFRFMSGGRPSGQSTIRTPVASIGVRGTILEGVVGREAIAIATRELAVGPNVGGDPNSATLVILRGPGPQQQGNSRPGAIDVTAAGKVVTIDRPMMAVYVPGAGKPPIGPFRITPTGLAGVRALLMPLPSGVGFAGGGGTSGPSSGGNPPNPGGVADGGRPDGYKSGGTAKVLGPIAGLLAALGGVIATNGNSRPASP